MNKLPGTRSYSSASHSSPAPGGKKKFWNDFQILFVIGVLAIPLLFGYFTTLGVGGEELASVLGSRLSFLFQCLSDALRGDRGATLEMGGSREDSPGSSAEEPGAGANPVFKMTGSEDSVNQPSKSGDGSANKTSESGDGSANKSQEVDSYADTTVSRGAQSDYSLPNAGFTESHLDELHSIMHRVKHLGIIPGNDTNTICNHISRTWDPMLK